MMCCFTKAPTMTSESLLDEMPLVAILRGLTPDRAEAVGDALFSAGIRAIEVPLNSPAPFDSIARLSKLLGNACLIGAGTVLDVDEVGRVFDAGGQLIVSPNMDSRVIARAISLKMVSMPGFATATEAFAAIAAGATRLKLFPAATYGPAHVAALRAVLPDRVKIYAVGGVGADLISSWLGAGAAGFGLGSELFKPDYSLADIAARARRVVEAFGNARRN
jgi:2-dehydro-3-deoxyphosphogalactonate aldolase